MALKSSIKWGVNGHNKYSYPAYAANDEKALELAAELGCTIYRINARPKNAEQVAYTRGVIEKCHALGMEVMVVLDYGLNWGKELLADPEKLVEEITYIGENLKDVADYFQMLNETDIWCSGVEGGYYNLTDPTGQTPGYFNPERVEIAVALMKLTLPALQAAAPGVKTCINFGVRHYPILDWYIEAGLKWDIIAIDNYEIWDYYEFFHFLEDRYPDYDLMVAECNYPALWGPYDDPDKQEAEWLEMFLNKMNEYDSDRLKAVFVYELLDQPEYELKKGSYHGESHFGLVALNDDNTIKAKKPAFDVVKRLYRGE
ncbi:MAG: hypothetical protein E7552_04985 [Ruminococcaceae bacterium]|nr:hypothetical protein [Oscillospiraceae bacterium]